MVTQSTVTRQTRSLTAERSLRPRHRISAYMYGHGGGCPNHEVVIILLPSVFVGHGRGSSVPVACPPGLPTHLHDVLRMLPVQVEVPAAVAPDAGDRLSDT